MTHNLLFFKGICAFFTGKITFFQMSGFSEYLRSNALFAGWVSADFQLG